MSEPNAKELLKGSVGCTAALFSLFIETPLWLYILHSILGLIGAGQFLWAMFWTYVLVKFSSSFLFAFLKALSDKPKSEARR